MKVYLIHWRISHFLQGKTSSISIPCCLVRHKILSLFYVTINYDDVAMKFNLMTQKMRKMERRRKDAAESGGKWMAEQSSTSSKPAKMKDEKWRRNARTRTKWKKKIAKKGFFSSFSSPYDVYWGIRNCIVIVERAREQRPNFVWNGVYDWNIKKQ